MSSWMLHNGIFIRVGVFLAVFGLMATWELLAARRERVVNRGERWISNIGLIVLDTVVVRLLFRTAAVGMALTAEQLGWGLFNAVPLPYPLTVLLAVVLLDLTIYLQHVMFHALPTLWRFHMVHHADIDLDVTTGIRFHPIEMVLSMLIKMSTVALLGAPAVAVLLFEVLLVGLSMFNHANVHVPIAVEPVLRWFIVTPDMHRVHHSIEHRELNSQLRIQPLLVGSLVRNLCRSATKGTPGNDLGSGELPGSALAKPLAHVLDAARQPRPSHRRRSRSHCRRKLRGLCRQRARGQPRQSPGGRQRGVPRRPPR